jgi:hypothetical protein
MPEIPQHVSEKAEAIQARLNSRISAARSNADLTADGKTKEMARAYLEADEAMTKLKDAWQGGSEKDVVALGRDIFGSTSAAGVDAISSRDADDRAASLDNAQAALDLLERAEENGDSVLARAIAQRAYRNRSDVFGGWEAVLDAYTTSRPEVAEKIHALDDARRNTIRTNFAAGITFSLNKPAELGNAYSTHAISRLAGIGA